MSRKITPPKTEEELETLLSEPDPEAVAAMGRLEGDILVLGVAGKVGVTLAAAAARACRAAGLRKKVIGVARFSDPGSRRKLEESGVETVACDLLDRGSVEKLPDAANLIFMAGKKFGTGGAEEQTWAMNTVAPVFAAERFPRSRTVVYSTGCVYDFEPPSGGGSREGDEPRPTGEYAQSALGRERVFQYYSRKNGTPVLIFRLNYAVEPRYGVLRDIADRVMAGLPVDLGVSNFNCIWQGDVITQTLLSLERCSSPAAVLNITGPETVSVRWAALEFGRRFGREPRFAGSPGEGMYLSNAAEAAGLFGYPRVSLREALDLTADWMLAGGASLGKPTHFESRDGNY